MRRTLTSTMRTSYPDAGGFAVQSVVALVCIGLAQLACSETCTETLTCSSKKGDDAGPRGAGGGSPEGAGGNDLGAGGSGRGGSSQSGGGGRALGGAVPATGRDAGAQCSSGLGDCNHDPADGCEVQLATDVTHCGACGIRCATDGTVSLHCVAGECKPTCDANHFDCNTEGADGCEADITSDPKNCGACGHSCSTAGSTSTDCVKSKCAPACDVTHADCDKDRENGCEIDLARDTKNCGVCGHQCAATNATTVMCDAGTCRPTCANGYGDCTTPSADVPDNGCEANLNAGATCGACNHNCKDGPCSGQTCQPVTLAGNLTLPLALAVDASYVHWVDQVTTAPRVVRVPLSGKGPVTIANEAVNYFRTNGLAANGTYVIWATDNTAPSGSAPNGSIRRVQTGSANVTTLATGIHAVSVVVDSGHVYWSDVADGRIHQVGLDGTLPQAITPPVNDVRDLVVDATRLFYI
jgi:hypothetical protein